MSQLDLACVAGVSSRHVSFLETARALPSAAMVLRLAQAMDVPLRHVNALLRAADHEPRYPEPDAESGMPDEIQRAISLLKAHHDPYPLIVMNREYDVLDMNAGALALFGALLPPEALQSAEPMNLVRLTFSPEVANGALVNFDEVGNTLLWRMQRELMDDPDNTALRNLLDDILAMPTVNEEWREADLTVASTPAVMLYLQTENMDLRFLTMITAFQAPQTVALDELRIETWLPVDEETAVFCRGLVGE
jgi:transcriptional regulator with XRE-family HTH domain